MKIRVPDIPQTHVTGFHPVEAERTIHLVPLSEVFPHPSVVSQQTAPKIATARTSSRKSQHIRESEKMSTLALAGAALLAPVIWMGHALLVWLDLF
jgi:hypothetical protein